MTGSGDDPSPSPTPSGAPRPPQPGEAKASAVAGMRAAIPLALAALPFGLVYGVTVSESTVPGWLGGAASVIVLAGAAQLSILSLIDAGAAWPVVVGTALVINARFALYSTALAPSFSEMPRRWRFGLPYLMTDQAASLAIVHFAADRDPFRRRWWYLGAGGLFASAWFVGTGVGIVMGDSIPADLDIGFAVPAMFLALLVPTLTDRPGTVAAAVAAAVAVVGAGLPNGSNVIVAALAGIAVGRLASPSAGPPPDAEELAP